MPHCSGRVGLIETSVWCSLNVLVSNRVVGRAAVGQQDKKKKAVAAGISVEKKVAVYTACVVLQLSLAERCNVTFKI